MVVAFSIYRYLTGKYDKDLSGTSTSESASQSSSSSATESDATIMAPDFEIFDADGKSVKLSDFKGKPVVVNFWATWCGWCVKEMPYYEDAIKEYGDDIQFLMINQTTDGETQEAAEKFMTDNNFTFDILFDNDLDASIKFGARSLPMSFFINENGELVETHPGYIEEDVLQEKLQNLLK